MKIKENSIINNKWCILKQLVLEIYYLCKLNIGYKD